MCFKMLNVFSIKICYFCGMKNLKIIIEKEKGSIYGWGAKKRKNDSRTFFGLLSTNTI
jgi:hypothetical protein